MPKADKVDGLYLSLASVEVKSLRGGGGSDLGERKYGNWMFAERGGNGDGTKVCDMGKRTYGTIQCSI